MIETKLILIEGPPGSGKSSTAQRLAEAIAQRGIACQCYNEWSSDHPIPIGDDLNLGAVIASSRAREEEVLRCWHQLARKALAEERVTVMESRFWQTSAMLMYAAGHPVQGIYESNRRVVEAIRELDPVLIYLVIDDLRPFLEGTIAGKEAEWQRGGLPGSWVGHVVDALDPQPWFTARGLKGPAGYVAFLEEWAQVSEELYQRLPFRKVKISNPYQDWQRADREIVRFVEL